MIPLSEEIHSARFGGKAAQLSTALRAGLPVPNGLALDVEMVERVVARNASWIEHCYARCSEFGRFAVRSSAIGEDSAGASFAGQHVTRLGVCGVEGFVEAVRAVWESARSESALAYRRRLGLEQAPRIAAVVQQMIDAECAGVMFTADPRTGADLRVVEAAWGLGEVIVSGVVDPDRYVLERGGRVVERVIGDKDVALRFTSSGGTEEYSVSAEMRQAPTLSDVRLRALDELATRCDAVFGDEPHDIEFAWKDEQLFLLQRRPVTR